MLVMLFTADRLRCHFCFFVVSNFLDEFMGVGEGNELVVDTAVDIFSCKFSSVSLFSVVIFVGVKVNELVMGVESWSAF